jgi:prophage tail gpP-like protein
MDKPIDKKTVDTLAMLIASKTGLDDNFALVARKVIDDYVSAKKIITQYNEAAERAAKEQQKEKKTKRKQTKKDASKAAKKKDK